MKRECETCIKRKTIFCPTSMECMATDDMPYYQNRIMLLKENQELKKQLEYLRSGEYYNQLRFENKMLQDIVDNGEVSKEDREFIDCTHRNTELLEQQKEFIKYMENIIKELECVDAEDEEIRGYLYQRAATFKEILTKYKEIFEEKEV